MTVSDLDTGKVIAGQAWIADDPFSRMKGLLGRNRLEPGEGLVITHCNSVHMFFMRFSIDVVFIDRQGMVVGLVERLKPFLLSPVFWKAASAIELPPGTIEHNSVKAGHRLIIRDHS